MKIWSFVDFHIWRCQEDRRKSSLPLHTRTSDPLLRHMETLPEAPLRPHQEYKFQPLKLTWENTWSFWSFSGFRLNFFLIFNINYQWKDKKLKPATGDPLVNLGTDRDSWSSSLAGSEGLCFTDPSWMGCSHRETWRGQSTLWAAETSVSQPFLSTGWPLLSGEDFSLPLVFSAHMQTTSVLLCNWSACGNLCVLRSCWRTESLRGPGGAEVWAGFYLLSTVITFHYLMSLPHDFPPHTSTHSCSPCENEKTPFSLCQAFHHYTKGLHPLLLPHPELDWLLQ